MTLHHSLPLLEIRAQPEGLIEGYASVFGGVDSYGDTINPGAFKASLANHKSAGTSPVMLWSHKTDAPIGRWTSLVEDGRGLRTSGQLNLKTNAGREAFEHLLAGDLNGLSIGYQVPAGGSEIVSGVNVLKQISLAEISIVCVPADASARIHAVKATTKKPATLRALERALLTLGYSRKEAAHIATKGFGQADELDPTSDEMAAVKSALANLSKTFS